MSDLTVSIESAQNHDPLDRESPVAVDVESGTITNGTVEVTVTLPSEAVQVLREYAEKRGITMTEALRRFISNENYLIKQVEEGGNVLIETKDKELRRLVFA
jgi:hypothetical protein